MKPFFSTFDIRLSTRAVRRSGGYTILELMVSIVIFTLGFLGSYLLIESANDLSVRSRDEVIGGNLMREQVELLKNLRDTNWIQYKKWNSAEWAQDPSAVETTFGSGFYTIENDFTSTKTIAIKKLNPFSSNKEDVLAAIRSGAPKISLCMDTLNRYTYSCDASDKKTSFASFFKLEPLVTKDATNTTVEVPDSLKVTLYFVTTGKRFHVYTMDTIIADWKK